MVENELEEKRKMKEMDNLRDFLGQYEYYNIQYGVPERQRKINP